MTWSRYEGGRLRVGWASGSAVSPPSFLSLSSRLRISEIPRLLCHQVMSSSSLLAPAVKVDMAAEECSGCTTGGCSKFTALPSSPTCKPTTSGET
eukprot:767949-Hanusia_phi.AAC.9